MTPGEQKELRDYSAHLMKSYGFDIPYTDPVMPALFIIHKEMSSAKVGNERLTATITEAVKKLNVESHRIAPPGEAWKSHLAASVKWIALSISMMLIMFILLAIIETDEKVEQAEKILEASPAVSANFLKNVLKDSEGFYYLEFSEATGSRVKYFVEYDKVGNGKVRVYLGKKY